LQSPKGVVTKSRQITLAAVFSAVYFVLRVIPTFQMVGVSAYFTAGDFLLTTIALVAGLWSGSLAVVVGTLTSYAVKPPVFFGLDFLPALANVSVASFLISGRRKSAVGLYVVILAAFLVSPYSLLFGYGGIPYVWLHLIALAVLLSPISGRIVLWVNRWDYRGVIAVAALAFIGTMAQHLVGGILYEFSVGFVGGVTPQHLMDLWRVIFWLYPTERVVLIVISTLIAVPVYRSYKRFRR